MKAIPGFYPAPASAKVLLNRLKEVSPIGNDINLHLFHGIENSDEKNSYHIYCYCISFLQMFLHCSDVLDYFMQAQSLNKSEKLIHNIIKSLYDKQNKKSIQIFDFIEEWRCWKNNERLPRKMSDISKFIRYFLSSLSAPLKDLFYINIDSVEKTIYGETFFITIPSTADTIQKNIDIKLSSNCHVIVYPKYIILYVDRSENGGGFNTNYVAVNTFLSISNVNYKFKSAILFTGNYRSGHYTNLIKIGEKYFYFNDENVYSVFYTKKPTAKTPNIIYDVNNGLNRNCNLLLYEMYEDVIDSNVFEVFEKKIYTEKSVSEKLAKIFKDFTDDPNYIQSNSSYVQNIEESSSSNDNGESFFGLETSDTNQNSIQESDELPIIYENRTCSAPRPFYESNQVNESIESLSQFDSAPLSPIDRSASIETVVNEVLGHNVNMASHLFLNRTKVDVETLNATNLCGTVNINIDGIPSCHVQRTTEAKYNVIRKLFKYAGLVLKKLEYNDLGAINAERMKAQQKMEPIDQKEIHQQGMLTYRFLTKILREGNFDYKKVCKALSPIVGWYRKKYAQFEKHDFTYSKKIDEDLEKSLQEKTLSPKQASTDRRRLK